MRLPEAVLLQQAAIDSLSNQQATVMVSVLSSRGSAPRRAGTVMLVSAQSTHGTIGGGHLEHEVIQTARRFLLGGGLSDGFKHIQEYALGASLGQCCGGAMQLSYEALNAQHVDVLTRPIEQFKTLYLFGAGHVAQALVPLLSPMPLRVVWADSRDVINLEQAPFPAYLPAHISTVVSDTLDAELSQAQQGDMTLIMTHSHALDERLVEAALKQNKLAYIGLIGSATKRRLFEQRLSQRGMDTQAFKRLVCPIGLSSAHNTSEQAQSKLPAVIAVQVAAQLSEYL